MNPDSEMGCIWSSAKAAWARFTTGWFLLTLPLSGIWRAHKGIHFAEISMIFVSDLLDHPGRLEPAATTVVPRRG